MWRYRVSVKGSASERRWLNRRAQHGWKLTAIHGNWYRFAKTTAKLQIFSEYVPSKLAVPPGSARGPFEVLVTCPINEPDVVVLYSAAAKATHLIKGKVDNGDATLQLKVALALRAHQLNLMNIFFIGGLAIVATLGFKGILVEPALDWTIALWLAISLCPLLVALRAHRQVVRLRLRTQQYQDAWKPTQHVFLSHMTQELDVERVKDLGEWTLVGHGKNVYWYDVRTLASLAEIKQALRPVVGPDVEISVLSFLGLGPIGFM